MTEAPPTDDNFQPWKWRTGRDRIDLFADYRRQLVYADPARRDLHISCGAALHHLQIASAGLGWRARVRRRPDPSDERHIASITLKPRSASVDDQDLLEALTRRRTDRRRFTSWPVPPERGRISTFPGRDARRRRRRPRRHRGRHAPDLHLLR